MEKGKYSLKPDPPDPRDYVYKAKGIANLPRKVDLRKYMSPVVNQYWLNSCVSNVCIAGYREYLMNYHNEVYVPLSRLYHYWRVREDEGTIHKDEGAYLRTGLKILQQRGVCPEELHPYVPLQYKERPSVAADIAAGAYKIDEYWRIMTMTQLREKLAEGVPVLLGMAVYESYESSVDGTIPMPGPSEMLLGYHAVLACGYDDDTRRVLFRNSYGEEWGNQGYGTISYDYINGPMLVPDMWVGEYMPKTPWENITAEDAVNYIASQKFSNGEPVFDSPEFWRNFLTSEHEYVALAFRKFAAYLKEQTTRT